MSYFNHSFQKAFVATGAFIENGTDTTADLTFSTGAGAEFGFFNSKTYLNVDTAGAASAPCPLILASAGFYSSDKIGKFHGGYQESNKSKIINPKYVTAFYKVNPCDEQQAQVLVGMTQNQVVELTGVSSSSTTITVSSTADLVAGMKMTITSGTGTLAAGGDTILSITNATTFEVSVAPSVALSAAAVTFLDIASDCNKSFMCDETYNLRVDVKGTPALQYLTRNAYLTVDGPTGCCADPDAAPVEVNPLKVYASWALNLLRNETINPFITVTPTYTTDDGVTWLALGDGTASAANIATLQDYVLDVTTLPGDADTVAGMIINGAYVDTRFETCTFYPNDGTRAYLEPVAIYASEVDLNGDPCEFTGLCNNTYCEPIQQSGSGENVVREVILTEAYRQQPMHTGKDLRIREITQGNQIFDAIDKDAAGATGYVRYYIEHVVPRFNNPSGMFDNDRYLLCIVIPQANDATHGAALEGFVDGWLAAAQGDTCIQMEEYDCPTACTPITAAS